MNKKSEVYLVEIITIIMLCSVILGFISTFPIPSPQNSKLIYLTIMGNDVLSVLDSLPNNNTTYHNSTLTEFIATNNITALTEFINDTLPITISYNILKKNLSARVELYTPAVPNGDIAVVHRLISYYKNQTVYIYNIELVLWYEYRV